MSLQVENMVVLGTGKTTFLTSLIQSLRIIKRNKDDDVIKEKRHDFLVHEKFKVHQRTLMKSYMS